MLSWLIAMIVLFYYLGFSETSPWWLLIPAYKVFETALFFVHWILFATGPVYSYKRSLIGILFNLAEIAIYSAIAFVLFGCFNFREALCNSIINILTISIANPGATGWCKSVMVIELLTADFLILIILASLIGQLRRRGER